MSILSEQLTREIENVGRLTVQRDRAERLCAQIAVKYARARRELAAEKRHVHNLRQQLDAERDRRVYAQGAVTMWRTMALDADRKILDLWRMSPFRDFTADSRRQRQGRIRRRLREALA